MKSVFRFLLFVVMASLLFGCQSEETLQFDDDRLQEAIETELNVDELYQEDAVKINELDLSGLGIQDLEGIQYLTALEELNLQENEIEDLSLLSELEKLKSLNIVGNPAVAREKQQTLINDLMEQGIEVVSVMEVEVVGKPDGPGGFLWKVENGETTVYLQGTIHIANEGLFPLNEKIEKAYAESDVVVPEIDLTNINPLTVQGMTMELATYDDGSTLRDHLSPELYTELDTVMQEFNMPLQMLEQFKPWFLSQTIQQLMIEKLGYTAGVDEYSLNRADEDEKEIIALETVNDQLSIFADTSMDYQLQMLEESLVDIEEFDSQMQEMLSLYKEGDAEKLLNSLTDEDAEVSEEEEAFMEALNDDRNYGMAEKIDGFLEKDSGDTYFVIVGSLHLLLEPHVLSILEDEGYEVEKVL